MSESNVNRISLYLSTEQIDYIKNNIIDIFKEGGHERVELVDQSKVADIVMFVLHMFKMPKRHVRPKSEIGQGRKKKNKNINTESKQDVFPFHENSLAPYVGVNSDAK